MPLKDLPQPPQELIDEAIERGLPSDRHITYQIQYRKCGKKESCYCHMQGSKGHGPYWYGSWQDDCKKKEIMYIGKV